MIEYIALAICVFVVWRALKYAARCRLEQDRANDELHRWRVGHSEAERWLAEFQDVAMALEHLKAKAEGTGGTDISRTRDAMRKRRASATGDRRTMPRHAPHTAGVTGTTTGAPL